MGRHDRRREKDVGLRIAHAAEKVSVHCSQDAVSACRHASLSAQARSASRWCHDRAGTCQRLDISERHRFEQNRFGPWRDEDMDIGVDGSTVHYARRFRDVLQTAVRARSDKHVVDRFAGAGVDRKGVARRMGLGDEGRQIADVEPEMGGVSRLVRTDFS